MHSESIYWQDSSVLQRANYGLLIAETYSSQAQKERQ